MPRAVFLGGTYRGIFTSLVMSFHVSTNSGFLPFASTVVNALGFEKVIKYKDDNITHFKHYDHFYLLLTVGILKFLSEIVDPALLASPELLLAQVAGHQGRRYSFSFLHTIEFVSAQAAS